ncbi:peptidase domain-containing ABC transporter [Caenispirillum bisanense]|uniref:ATP-binding cassette, subfamily C/ATP-binding cassette, subfamily C, LapB n=1 Tax=Caenispirillum bisanense TaxID=414052 RepID=A0A286GTD5_9PROT|nr:ATP-binding cassette domain-containing protein [Caenispirillum bisanense]SOD98702.1 ATP-binding cassette, subfamily C/ATP-binding cassette, subfamily C, LapB [Caenispirillum bisanense]
MTDAVMTPGDAAALPEPGGWGRPREQAALSHEQIVSGRLGGFKAVTDLAHCLLPLLEALGWDGDPRQVSEALPHFADQLDLTDFLNVMANLGWSSRSLRVSLRGMDPRLAPCLFLPDRGLAKVVVRVDETGMTLFDPQSQDYVTQARPRGRGRLYVFHRDEDDVAAGTASRQAPSETFVSDMVRRFRPLVIRALLVSLLANVLALGVPLFTMTVYDKVIATGSMELLTSMLIGVAIALLGDYLLRALRAHMIAYIGARLDHILGNAVFQRLIGLPPAYTEMANINSQVARLKDFEVVREFFTGPLATVIFEIPFALVFLLVMALLGGPLAFVPMAGVAAFVIAGLLLRPRMRAAVAEAGRASSRRQEFLVESFSRLRDIGGTGARSVWRDRYRAISADAAIKGFKSAQSSAFAAGLSQAIIVCTGIATLGWGVTRVLDGAMTVGGLIASMMLVWWVLRPLQAGFSTLSQIERMRDSVVQINRLMRLAPERREGVSAQTAARKAWTGRVTFSNVSMRYVADNDPALFGVNLQVEPGEIVGIVGPNGSGKSTILKLVLGMYRPQAGGVRLDTIDIRQIDPVELRRNIAYVPQHCELFFGTIGQNLRLADPTATDEDLRWACTEAGCLEEIEAMERGFDTRIGDGRTAHLASNLRQRLSLARAYLKRAPVMLFDEPANGLDFVGDQQFMKVLERIRGHATVFLVTHRPSHLRLCDKVIVMHQGQIRMMGPAKQVLDRLPAGIF